MAGAGLQRLLEVIRGAATLDGDLGRRRCLRDDRRGWLTYADVVSAAGAAATKLAGHRGGVALIAPGNDVGGAVALLGAWAAQLAVALIDPALEPAARTAIESAFQPEVVFGPAEGWSETGLSGDAVRPGLGVLLSTSGTTGSSKFVRLSTPAMAANAEQIAEVLQITPDDVAAGHLPLHYSYGLSVLLSHLARGAAVFLTETKVTSPDFYDKLAAAEATHLPGVPFHYATLARLGPDRLVPASVTTFTQAGGKLERRFADAIHACAQARGARFYVMYGQTEAGPRMTTLPADRYAEKSDSVGVALPGGRIEIVDEAGAPLPPGSQGQVVYHGPNVMWGYAEARDELALGDAMNGRLETGDSGWLDADGDLFIVGRNQRFAKVAGLRIGLDEVERRLRPNFDVALMAGADVIHVAAAEADASSGALAARLSAIASEFKIPARSFVLAVVPAIPLKASGKVDFAKLRALV